MESRNNILRYVLGTFSAVSSFLFVFYAVTILFGRAASSWLTAFAYVAGGYGLMNIYILSWAWRTETDWAPKANLVIAACFFGIFLMDHLRSGFPNGLIDFGALFGLGAVLAVNWIAIRKISRT